MKNFLPLLALFTSAAILSGCSLTDTPTQPAIPTPPLANVTCNELSFYLDSTLGNDDKCETIPENSSSDLPMGMSYVFIYPAHTELTIQNYPMTHTQFPPQIWVYPVGRFSELLPNYIPPRVSDLKKLIANDPWSSGELPFLPANPQIQTFYIHKAGILFNGGQGVRYITEYSDGPNPISNSNIIYTFQGLTDDGMYWVAATFPISSLILPENNDTLPEGYTQESLIQNYSSYVNDVKKALEAQAPDSFFPTIDSLDNLVKSITVSQ